MIQLLFTVLAAEAATVTAFLFSTTLRKLFVMGVDQLKRGHGPVVVKTVAATALVVFCSNLYSMAEINCRSAERGGGLTPTDQVLMSRNLLEATLMGFILFLALVVDRLHHYVRELRSLRLLRTSLEAAMKHNRALEQETSKLS